jgi:hypothetical protein
VLGHAEDSADAVAVGAFAGESSGLLGDFKRTERAACYFVAGVGWHWQQQLVAGAAGFGA